MERSARMNPVDRRPAFSLTELLVVIGIIGILAAVSAVAVTKIIGSQRNTNTQGVLRTVQKTLNEHWAYVVAEAKKETGLDHAYQRMDMLFGTDTSGGERNRVIWIKMRLMEAFPISYAEIAHPYPYSSGIIPQNMRRYNATYLQAIAGAPVDKSTGLPHDYTWNPNGTLAHRTESSACLLMALSIVRNGTALNIDNLGSNAVGDTDLDVDPKNPSSKGPDGVKEIVDSWGNAVTFYRFPTDNQALQASNPAGGNVRSAQYADPEDPGGTLFKMPMQQGRKTFEANVHKIASPFNPNAACYIVPTIVSPGPDGLLNLNQNMAIVNPKIDDDNIYSFQLR
jgi:prepilin-type N-terminal cleavage/methylation domain-containing protein